MSKLPEIDTDSEYKKDDKLNRDDVKSLMEWVAEQPHLPPITEFQAITFLHSTYYDLGAAQKTVDSFYTLRAEHGDIFDPILDESLIRDTLSTVFLKIMPEKTPEGNIVLISRLLDPDSSKFSILNYQKIIDMLLMSYLHKNGTFNGLTVIYDTSFATVGHIFKMNLNVLKHYVKYNEAALPVRLKQVHYINNSTITMTMLNLVKPLLSSGAKEMYYFHSGDHKTLHDHVPQQILPKEIYGSGRTIDEHRDGYIDDVIDSLQFFKWLQSQKAAIVKNDNKSRGWFGR